MQRMCWACVLLSCLPSQLVALHVLENQRTVKVFQVSNQYSLSTGGRPIRFSSETCDANCDYVGSVEEADVIFSNVGKTRVLRTPGSEKIWVGTFWESVQHYPALSKDYDFTISYRPDASFPNFAMIWNTARDVNLQKAKELVPYEVKGSLFGDTAVLISNCGLDKSGRLQLAKEMSAHGLTLDYYGRCEHTKDENEDAELLVAKLPDSEFDYIRQWHSGSKEKGTFKGWAAISGHLFTFAAENSICAYYHTEKVYRAFMTGSVPIYVGAATIYEYVPTNSIIMASDFKDLTELFSFLGDVRDNRAQYESFLAWRNVELPAHLQEKLDAERIYGSSEWSCNVCKAFTRGRPQHTVPSETLGCEPSTLNFTRAVRGRYPETAERLRKLIGDA